MEALARMGLSIDFEAHNARVKRVWQAFRESNPTRVPMTLGISQRFTLLNPEANQLAITWEEYFHDPEAMLQAQLQHQHWVRHNVIYDAELGLPEAWVVNVDFQNTWGPMEYGAEPRFVEGNVPDAMPIIGDDGKQAFIEEGSPELFTGWMGRSWEYYEYMRDRAEGYEFHGRPVRVGNPAGLRPAPLFTLACGLRGATELCLDLREDPEFVHALMATLTRHTIRRLYALRRRLERPMQSHTLHYGDDSVALLSPEAYREFVLPYHKRLFDEFGAEGPNSIHLCGDATHLFKTIRDELRVMTFDTGFPVDHGRLRRELGPEVTIQGGPHADLILRGSPRQVRDETIRILQSGVMQGGRFILREGNNLAPGTPLLNVQAMYDACRQFGRYEDRPGEM